MNEETPLETDVAPNVDRWLRDEFAGKAMAALIVARHPDGLKCYSIVADFAYDYAEAMMAERNKRYSESS